jgi:hypothetical protein
LFRKKKEELTKVNYLELTPVPLFEHIKEEDGKVSVLIPRFTNKLLVRIIVPRLKSPYVKTLLDEYGSHVWGEIDGKQKVSDISNSLREKFGEKAEPAEERVTKFLTQLYKYKFVTFKEIQN